MSIVEFTRSPLLEVVCGVEFSAPEFSSVHFGLYWQTIRDQFPEFPLDRPPIGEVELLPILPKLRRVWFESSDQKQLIQLQANRFHYNWRCQGQDDQYPHFEEVYTNFEREWEKFQVWWLKTSKSPIQSIAYELTYLNQIDQTFGWSSTEDHQKMFTFVGKKWDQFLKQPIVHNSNLEFSLPDGQGTLSVRMNQTIRVEDNQNLVFVELTTRSTDTSLEMGEWFKRSHEYMVGAFLDLLQEEIKREWGLQWLT